MLRGNKMMCRRTIQLLWKMPPSTKNGNEISLIFNTIALLFFKLLTVLTDFLLALVE
jgi:hypothetical protein